MVRNYRQLLHAGDQKQKQIINPLIKALQTITGRTKKEIQNACWDCMTAIHYEYDEEKKKYVNVFIPIAELQFIIDELNLTKK